MLSAKAPVVPLPKIVIFPRQKLPGTRAVAGLGLLDAACPLLPRHWGGKFSSCAKAPSLAGRAGLKMG